MYTIKLAIWSVCFISSQVFAQTEHTKQSTGDRQIKDALSPVIRQIYDAAGSWSFRFTRINVFDMTNARGTEIQSGFVDDRPARIIATVWTDHGKHSAEYYLRNDTLLHVYETMEYFEETAPEDAWRNFKGPAAWERRTYFQQGKIAYAEATGIRLPGSDDAVVLQARVKQALDILSDSGN